MGAGPSKSWKKKYQNFDLRKSLSGATSLKNIRQNMKKKKKGKKNKEEGDKLKIVGEYDNMFEGIDMKDGDESSAVPVWHTQTLAPKKCITKYHKPAPKYQIDFVYGGKMNDVSSFFFNKLQFFRNNMELNSKGHVVYTAGCLGIVYKINSNTQKFFGGELIDDSHQRLGKDIKYHTDEINCLTLCPDKKLCASGQIGMKPWVFIWKTSTCELVKKIRMEKGSKGISSM